MTRSGRALPRLIVMTRYPEPGAVKSRLVPALGETGAAALHDELALGALARAEVVLGPAADGGYYLVAVRADAAARALPALFGDHIEWGGPDVLAASLAALGAAGLAVELLETLTDVDRPDDLPVWERVVAERERVAREPRLSVVVPALDEEANIGAAVEGALAAGAHEVIVADGGSRDGTSEAAAATGARIVACERRGRAAQMNEGARVADGDVLLFLHADCRLPVGSVGAVREVLADPSVVLGSFGFVAGTPDRGLDRLITFVGRARHRVFALPYGDQAQFVRRTDFEDLGGYPELPTMEDYEFALRCARLGRLGVAPADVWTSARAWHDHGLVRTTLVNAAVIAGYRAGVAPGRLARWRRRVAR